MFRDLCNVSIPFGNIVIFIFKKWKLGILCNISRDFINPSYSYNIFDTGLKKLQKTIYKRRDLSGVTIKKRNFKWFDWRSLFYSMKLKSYHISAIDVFMFP